MSAQRVKNLKAGFIAKRNALLEAIENTAQRLALHERGARRFDPMCTPERGEALKARREQLIKEVAELDEKATTRLAQAVGEA